MKSSITVIQIKHTNRYADGDDLGSADKILCSISALIFRNFTFIEASVVTSAKGST